MPVDPPVLPTHAGRVCLPPGVCSTVREQRREMYMDARRNEASEESDPFYNGYNGLVFFGTTWLDQ